MEEITLYHFTDTIRLPWIMRSGELRPGANRIGGFPDPDFVWATTNESGDRSASGGAGKIGSQAYRAGASRLVRLKLRAEDFIQWGKIGQRYPAWTPDQIARLEAAAKGKSSSDAWWCRADPLPRSKWVQIDTRSYAAPTWKPLDLSTEVIPGPALDSYGVIVNGRRFCSAQRAGPAGATAYMILPQDA